MANERHRTQLDQLVSQRLTTHLRVRTDLKDVVPPQNVILLCNDLQEATKAKLWFLATCVCALLAELFYASESGAIFPKGESASHRWYLRSLRNACFHPAHVNPDAGSGKPHVETLADALERRGNMQIAKQLRRNYSLIRDFEMYALAVKMLDEMGQEFLNKLPTR